MQEICDEYDELLVCDELIYAFGCLGVRFVRNEFGYASDTRPDRYGQHHVKASVPTFRTTLEKLFDLLIVGDVRDATAGRRNPLLDWPGCSLVHTSVRKIRWPQRRPRALT
ncbi:hypothetical protein ATCCBAA256_08630 [Mycobacterium montefiorense]|nr:hypothetical protein ATCCBAA256_08630 [Mycobacterium montefiorense]